MAPRQPNEQLPREQLSPTLGRQQVLRCENDLHFGEAAGSAGCARFHLRAGRRATTLGALRPEPIEHPEALRPEWSALAERSGNLFATWEWQCAWWRHCGAGHELLAWLLRHPGGEPACILPFCRLGGGPIRLIGYGPSDRLAPICAPADRSVAAGAVAFVLAGQAAGERALVAEDMPAEEGWADLLGGEVVARQASPVLPLDGLDWNAYMDSRSANFRQQLRARERRLLREHDVRFRVSDNASLEADLDALMTLHDARWSGLAGTYAGGFGDLHRDFARVALERGWLHLRVLECAGRPVAALHAFRFGAAEWYYQAGRDPAFDRWSVGSLLLARAVREAIEDGLREYRFLRGGERYKRRFADGGPGVVTVRVALDRVDPAQPVPAGGDGAVCATARGERRVRSDLPVSGADQ